MSRPVPNFPITSSLPQLTTPRWVRSWKSPGGRCRWTVSVSYCNRCTPIRVVQCPSITYSDSKDSEHLLSGQKIVKSVSGVGWNEFSTPTSLKSWHLSTCPLTVLPRSREVTRSQPESGVSDYTKAAIPTRAWRYPGDHWQTITRCAWGHWGLRFVSLKLGNIRILYLW